MLAGLGGTVNLNADLFSQTVTSRNLRLQPGLRRGADRRHQLRARQELALLGGVPRATAGERHSSGADRAQRSGNLDLTVNGVLDYSPHQVALGAQIPIIEDLKISFDLVWQHWSVSPNPAMSIDVTTNGGVITPLGLDKVLAIQTNDPPPGFTDTLTPAASIQYDPPGHMWVIRAGYAYRPTYVPNQVYSTNYLDADAHIVGLGCTFRFYDALGRSSRIR